MLDKKVVVTGSGVVSSIGYNKEEYWQALLAGKSNFRPITSFESSPFNSDLGGEVDWIKIHSLLESIGISHDNEEEATKLALLSTHEALTESGLLDSHIDYSRVGCVVGTLCSSSRLLEALWRSVDYTSKNGPATAVSHQANRVSEQFALGGPINLVSTACASFIDGYGLALDLIREGHADIMVVTGGDIISESVHAGFNAVYSITKGKPMPFDADRNGFAIGEGSATIILESEAHAKRRGAPILCEALGYGGSNSAFHLTSPSDDAYGEKLAVTRAIKDSGIAEGDIDYVLAHGTGTFKNDKTELYCLSGALKTSDRNRPLYVTSIKGSTGHCMGAAGGMSMIASIKSLHEGIVPLTANTKTRDPLVEQFENIDIVIGESLDLPINNILINSLGFAGNNAVAIIGRYPTHGK